MAHEDSPDEERIGARDLTAWPSAIGRWLVQLVLAGARWMGSHGVLAVTAAVGLAVAVIATWGFGEVYESVVEQDDLAAVDRPVLDLAVSWRSPGLDAAVTAFTDLGGTIGMPVLVVLAVVAFTIRRRSWTPLALVVIAASGSLLMTVAGKDLVGRARPPQSLAVPPFETSPSFPSGHTLNAVVLTGVVVYLLLGQLESARARVAVVVSGVVFAVAIGLSRVFLGHHWLTDVVAAFLLGLGWLAAVITAHRLYLTVRTHRRDGANSAATARQQ